MPNLAHFAINAADVPRARRFYEQVFGWTFTAWGPPGFYQITTNGPGEPPGTRGSLQGRRELVPGQQTIGFECTVSVPSIDDTERAVLANGGKVIMEKSIIVGVGTLMFFQDTEGNVMGAMQYDARAE
ncbi:MAG: VOC family protein [Gemmatimonadaceae bacterium]